MAAEYYRWYREGTVSVTASSTSVTGTNTYWLTAGLHPGDMFSIDSVQEYEIKTITDNSHLTLTTAYQGSTASGSTYRIIRNFTASSGAETAAKVAELYGDMARYWDEEHTTIHGKSAYEIAKSNGYTGSESQWLESLKAAGEWETLNTRTNLLTYKSSGTRNFQFRGMNLGTAITATQIANIKAMTLNDLYLGDYWRLNLMGATATVRIVGFNTYRYNYAGSHAEQIAVPTHAVCTIFWQDNYRPPMNSTDTLEGHIKGTTLYQEVFPELQSQLEALVGADNIVGYQDYVADAVNSTTGAVSHRVVQQDKIMLPSFFNLTGLNDSISNAAWFYANRVYWPAYMLAEKSCLNWGYVYTSQTVSSTKWGRMALQGHELGTMSPIVVDGYFMPFFLLR